MKKLILMIVIITAISNISLLSQADTTIKHFLSITGEAKLEIVPDEIYLSITLDEEYFNGKKSLIELEKDMVQRFEKIGINIETQLSTDDISSSYDFKMFKKDDIFEKKHYELKLSEAKTTMLVLKELKNMEIAQVSLIRTDHSKMEEYKIEAIAKAMKNAKAKAEAITAVVGQKLGKAYYISDTQVYSYQKSYSGMERAASMDLGFVNAAFTANIDIKKITINSTINVQFAL